MCPFDEQQLQQLLAKPMPELDPNEFSQRTVNNLNNNLFKRFVILQFFTFIAAISLLWFLPSQQIIDALVQLKLTELASIKSFVLTSSPLFIVAMVCFFMRSEVT